MNRRFRLRIDMRGFGSTKHWCCEGYHDEYFHLTPGMIQTLRSSTRRPGW
jgi:hypothetical protein